VKEGRQHHSKKPLTNILYGKNPVVEAIKAGKRKTHEVLVATSVQQAKDTELFDVARKHGVKIAHAEMSEITNITQGAVHQGVVARVGPYPEYFLEDTVKEMPERNLVLVLDSVQDPQNFGTLCRSALAFGVKEVIVPRDRSVPITATVAKASAGAIEHLKIISVTNLVRAMEVLKKNKFWLYGASLDADSQDLNTIDPGVRAAIVLGSEGKGLRRLVSETCDIKVKIPMAAGFDSLNVAQAGTVFMYEFNRKLDLGT